MVELIINKGLKIARARKSMKYGMYRYKLLGNRSAWYKYAGHSTTILLYFCNTARCLSKICRELLCTRTAHQAIISLA